jgi:hypothetical protein
MDHLILPQEQRAPGRDRKGRYAARFYPLTKTSQSEILRFVRLDLRPLILPALCHRAFQQETREETLVTNQHLAQ